MAVIRGRYISLSSSQQRRQRLEQHLQTLGVQERYDWFPAVRGDVKAACRARTAGRRMGAVAVIAEPAAGGVAPPGVDGRLAAHP